MAGQLCLGPALFCANCCSKMNQLLLKGLRGFEVLYQCSCSNCQTGKFSRCAWCQIVPYCSKDCQIEHWRSHKRICKKLSRIVQCEQSELSQVVLAFYFNYDPNIKPETVLRIRLLPFPLDIKKQHGWIDGYLVCLIDIIESLPGFV